MKPQYTVEKVDIDKCLEVFGGSRFQMILGASIRAREIANARIIADRAEVKPKYDNKPVVTALCEIADGKIGVDYLNKLK